MSQPATTPVQPASDTPQIAGNLWWDDVRLGAGMVFAGLLLYLAPLLGRDVLIDLVNYLLLFVSAVLILVGLKLCLSAPPEANASLYAYGAVGAFKLALLAFIVLLIVDRLSEFALVLAALGLLGNVLLALFVRSVAQYLRAQSLALLAMQYAMLAAVISVAVIVAAMLHARFISDGLTLLLIGVQAFLVGHLYQAIANVQKGLAAEMPHQPSGIEEAAEAATHTLHEPIPVVPAPYFSDKQWEVLETSDKSAGRAVIGLMTMIFLIGVFLYSIIATLAMLS